RHGGLVAARQLQALRNLVVERLRHRQRDQDGSDDHLFLPRRGRWRGAPSRRDGGGSPRTPMSRAGPVHHAAHGPPPPMGEELARPSGRRALNPVPMKLFLDTADVAVIKDLVSTGMVDGVTTTPSLIAKSGRNIAEVIAEICALVEGPISAEAVATDFETMVKEGDKLASKIGRASCRERL